METEAWNAADGNRALPARNAVMTRQEGRCSGTAPGGAPGPGTYKCGGGDTKIGRAHVPFEGLRFSANSSNAGSTQYLF